MSESITRSWGTYEVLQEGREFKVKRLTFEPGKILSLQKHFNREELWLFEKGQGLITVTDQTSRAWKNPTSVKQGDFIWIGKERCHSFIASEPTSVLEIQLGICEEDDIVRYPQPEWAPK